MVCPRQSPSRIHERTRYCIPSRPQYWLHADQRDHGPKSCSLPSAGKGKPNGFPSCHKPPHENDSLSAVNYTYSGIILVLFLFVFFKSCINILSNEERIHFFQKRNAETKCNSEFIGLNSIRFFFYLTSFPSADTITTWAACNLCMTPETKSS